MERTPEEAQKRAADGNSKEQQGDIRGAPSQGFQGSQTRMYVITADLALVKIHKGVPAPGSLTCGAACIPCSAAWT